MLDKKAIDRLYSLPSEIQAIKFAHDSGYIISEDFHFLPTKRFYQENGLDLLLYGAKETPGKTRMVGIDVKNHKEEYSNLFLETQTRPDKNGNRRLSWAFHNLMNGLENTKHNRYLLDVWNEHNGIKFSELIKTNELIQVNETEVQNEDRIIEFFSSHMELLNHDMMLYAFDDIDKELLRTGGIILKNRTNDILISTGVMVLICDWNKWDTKYARIHLWWDEREKRWKSRNCGQGERSRMYNYIITEKTINGVYQTAYGIEKRENEKISQYKESQKNGLNAQILKRILSPGWSDLTLPEWKDTISIEIDALEDRRIEILERLKKRDEREN